MAITKVSTFNVHIADLESDKDLYLTLVDTEGKEHVFVIGLEDAVDLEDQLGVIIGEAKDDLGGS